MSECGKRFVEIGGTGAARRLKPGESIAERIDKGGGKRPGHRLRIEETRGEGAGRASNHWLGR